MQLKHYRADSHHLIHTLFELLGLRNVQTDEQTDRQHLEDVTSRMMCIMVAEQKTKIMLLVAVCKTNFLALLPRTAELKRKQLPAKI